VADPTDPYKVLQVDPEAEDEVVHAAYRRLARKYHPDLAAGPEAAARMLAINAAWDLIGEPDRRAAFERERARRARPVRADASEASAAPAQPRPAQPRPAQPTRAQPTRAQPPPPPPPETVSRDWTSGRSTVGGGYDPSSMRAPEGHGAAGPPPGNPSGSVLTFGRYAGWSLGEVARHDLEFLEWLDRAPIGRQYRDEIDQILRRSGRRASAEAEATVRRGLFRRG
jgi:curved DNA-binding protein CbpA